jgi:hypothetical protein
MVEVVKKCNGHDDGGPSGASYRDQHRTEISVMPRSIVSVGGWQISAHGRTKGTAEPILGRAGRSRQWVRKVASPFERGAPKGFWLQQMLALANKTMCVVGALLMKNEDYNAPVAAAA